MKKLLLLFLLFPLVLSGQSSDEAGLYETVRLKIKKGQEKAFEAAVKKHNLEYHKEGTPYRASLYYNINGPDGGSYTWVMGPTNFTAMDTRPSEGSHDEDWARVAEYVETGLSPEFWDKDFKLSYSGTNTGGNKSLVWIYDLKPGKFQRWGELLEDVREVYEKKRPEESFLVYWNEFTDSKAGRDAAIIFPFEKWAWLDVDSNFGKDFEEVHGPSTWRYFLNEIRDCIAGRSDYLRERVD